MVQIFVCRLDHWETMGMWPCPRCGQLTYGTCDETCDMTPAEVHEHVEEGRDGAGRPDADHDEVLVMLADPGVVEYHDPRTLYGDGYDGEYDHDDLPELV